MRRQGYLAGVLRFSITGKNLVLYTQEKWSQRIAVQEKSGASVYGPMNGHEAD